MLNFVCLACISHHQAATNKIGFFTITYFKCTFKRLRTDNSKVKDTTRTKYFSKPFIKVGTGLQYVKM